MSKRSTDKRSTEESKPVEALPATRYYETLFHAAGDVAGEAALFARQRFDKDAVFSHKLSTCSNPLEALGLQQSWVAEASRDYLSECARMSNLMFRYGSQPSHLTPLRQEFDAAQGPAPPIPS